MKLSLLVLTLSIIVPSLAAVTETTSVDTEEPSPDPQLHSSHPHPHPPSLCSPFGHYSPEYVLQLLQQDSVENALAGTLQQVSRDCLMPRLQVLFEDPCLERLFNSEQKRDRLLSRTIAAMYVGIVNQDRGSQGTCCKSESPDPFTRIQGEPRMNQPIEMLPTLSSSNFGFRILKMLQGSDEFSALPLAVRQLIARNMWPARGCTHQRIGSLSSFLLAYWNCTEIFKDSLAYIDPEVVAEACVRFALGLDSGWLPVGNRKDLLALIGSLFPPDSLPATACSLSDVLSFESPMSAILTVMTSMDARLVTILTAVLESSPEHVTANWCMTKLGRSPFLLILDNNNLHYHLLFGGAFRDKHGISDEDQSALLKSSTPEDLLKNVTFLDLYDPEIQALVKWVSAKVDMGAPTFPHAVALYSLDNDQNALLKYFPSSPKNLDLLAFTSIVLHLDYARHLIYGKRDALLEHLFPERASTFDANDRKHRKALIFSTMSSFKGPLSDAFVCSLCYCDFLLCVETCLDDPEACQLPAQLEDWRKMRAARKLVDYIGEDVEKVANLQQFPMHYQVMVFLLTDCEKVAVHLCNSLDKAEVMLHFVDCWHHSGFERHEEAKRASLRARACCQSLLTEPF